MPLSRFKTDLGLVSSYMADLDNRQIKKLARYFCQAYKDGTISEESFQQVFEYLLAFFIERTFENKFEHKTERLENKLFSSYSVFM